MLLRLLFECTWLFNTYGVLQMQIWDTAGQERFRTITQNYYRSAHGAMIAYDLTRRSTFDSLPHWIHAVEQYGVANVVFVLIGMSSCILLLCVNELEETSGETFRIGSQYK